MYDYTAPVKILIVDDDPFELEVLKQIVMECGEEPLTVTDPRMALELIKKYSGGGNPIDTAFIDFLMPGMDGITLFKKLKELDRELEVYIMSVDNSMEMKKNIASLQGIEGFINKSGDVEQIKRYVAIARSNKKQKLKGPSSL